MLAITGVAVCGNGDVVVAEKEMQQRVTGGMHGGPGTQEALQAFRAGKVQIMVATDVAARGLHIRNLPYVVNYDFPSRLETYIHRVGRTGRLAARGHAFSFLTRNLAPLAPSLLAFLQVSFLLHISLSALFACCTTRQGVLSLFCPLETRADGWTCFMLSPCSVQAYKMFP